MDQVVATGIPSKHIDTAWPEVHPLIQSALEYSRGELNLQDIYDRLKSTDMQLWVVFDGDHVVAAMTTELVFYPRKKICRIVTLGGWDFSQWGNHIELVADWARSTGCDHIETFARRGFVKTAKQYGFEEQYTLLSKPL
jgi:hypothetical protein